MLTKKTIRGLQLREGTKWKRVRLGICKTPRCNRLTANLGGKCKRCLDFSARQEALLAWRNLP